MATLEELQAKLTALTQRVNEITAPPDDYYTHRFSGEEIDNAVGRVADTPGSGAITAGDVGAAPAIEDTNNPGCFYRMIDGVQEWINPPMVLGVEYRTIERYNGRPVYARLNSVTGFGTPGTCSEVDIEIGASLLDLVSYSAQLSGWSIPTLIYGGGVGSGLTNAGNVQIEVRAVSTGKIEVYLFSASRNLSSGEVNLLIKYTKSE